MTRTAGGAQSARPRIAAMERGACNRQLVVHYATNYGFINYSAKLASYCNMSTQYFTLVGARSVPVHLVEQLIMQRPNSVVRFRNIFGR